MGGGRKVRGDGGGEKVFQFTAMAVNDLTVGPPCVSVCVCE